MFRPRIIPVLLLHNKGIYKTTRFKNPRYIGDPINTVKIFNDLRADELIILDISATAQRRTIPFEIVAKVGDEAHMPFAVGGGLQTVEHIRQVISAGAEKVVINSGASIDPQLVSKASQLFGSQSIIVSVDVRKNWLGRYCVYTNSGEKKVSHDLIAYVQAIEQSGAGEILIQAVDRDGLMGGFDIVLTKKVSEAVSIPVIACGGAGGLSDCREVISQGSAHAAAAGSMFVYHGRRNAILINYPGKDEMEEVFGKS